MEDTMTEDGYRITDTHVFFYKKWLSNFGKCKFTWTYPYGLPDVSAYDAKYTEDQEFFCTEQAFMWAKAVYFHDFDCARKIIAEKSSPSVCKNLGREVKNYDDARWEKVRYKIMMEVNYAKYSQNNDLLRKLYDLSDGGKRIFVEASPIDCIWGVGMDLSDDRIVDPRNWNGRNLLGKAITEALERILLSGVSTVDQLIEHLKVNESIIIGDK